MTRDTATTRTNLAVTVATGILTWASFHYIQRKRSHTSCCNGSDKPRPGTTMTDGYDDNNDKGNNNDDNDDNDTMYHGQCLKRQLRHPKLPYPLWDYNWDGRVTPETTLEAASTGKRVQGTTRHVILIRHGQYDETHQQDELRTLTELGREQAELTGRRLAIMAKGINEKFGACKFHVIRTSGMARARETAEIISKHLTDVELAEPDSMLNEALPAPMIPIRPDIGGEMEIDQHHDRIESAFQKYFYRSVNTTLENEDDKHEFEIIVCHGNVIRYFFCRALQIPPEAWLRMSLFNCSLTYLMIKPNGYASCRLLGDVGHLGYDHTTFSMEHGFAWSS